MIYTSISHTYGCKVAQDMWRDAWDNEDKVDNLDKLDNVDKVDNLDKLDNVDKVEMLQYTPQLHILD